MIRTVMFDVDGTIIDSVELHARSWQEAFNRFGYQTRLEDVRCQIGKGADLIIPAFVPEAHLERIYDELDTWRLTLFKTKYLPKVKGFPRVRDLFLRLRTDGKRIALVSSARKDELDGYERLAGVQDLVEVETSADDAEKSKPYPDIFEAALKKLGSPEPKSCVAVGDTPYDVIAARRAHIATVGLSCGAFPESALRQAGAVAVHHSPAALLAAYERVGDAAFAPSESFEAAPGR